MMVLAVTRHKKVIPQVTRMEALSVDVSMVYNGSGHDLTQEGHLTGLEVLNVDVSG